MALVPFNRRNSLFNAGFEDFYNMLDNFFNDDRFLTRGITMGSFKVDIQENENEYVVEAQLPGVKKEEINLILEDERLTIAVERRDEVNEEKKNYIHRESKFSSMSRSIYLRDALPEGVKAKLDNGVLYVSVPKQGNTRHTKRIEIE